MSESKTVTIEVQPGQVVVALSPSQIVALENVWHTAMNTPGDDHDRAEIEHFNEVAGIIAEARGESS